MNKWSKDGLVMSIYHHEHNRSLVAPLDRAQQGEAVLATARSPKRLVPKWGSEIFLGFLIAAAAMGLAGFATHLSNQDLKLADADKPGACKLVRIEIVRVWLPSALVELVKHEPPSGVLRTHEDLRRVLEMRGQENVWYAMDVRGHHDDGLIVVIPFVRRPYSEPQFFPELLEILAKAAGNSRGEQTDQFRATVVNLLPESFLKRGPRDAVADLLDDLSPSLNAERAR